MRKFFLLLTLLCTFLGSSLAQASQVTDVKWGLDKQNMLRFVVDLTEPATYQVSTEGRMLLVTVDADLKPQVAGTKKIKSSIADVMTVTAQGQQTLIKVPLWRDLAANEYRSFVLKKDPQTQRPPRIVVDITGTITAAPAESKPTAGSQPAPAVKPNGEQQKSEAIERPAPGGKVVVSNQPTRVPREPKTAPTEQGQATVQTGAAAAVGQSKPVVAKEDKAKIEAEEKKAKEKEKKREEKAKKERKQEEAKKSTAQYEVDGGLKGKVITLDPGHGGSDPGAIGKNGTMEKDITLEIAIRVKEGLEKKGAKVYLTRSEDVDVYGPNASAEDELRARVNVAEKKKADLFISIHINSSTNTKLGGFSSYYYPKTANDARIAESIQKQLTANFGVDDLGIREANFYVIKRCSMPATLLELCFISNPKEEAFLKGKWFPNKAAKLIVDGIVDYFK